VQKGYIPHHLWWEYLTFWADADKQGEKVGAIGLEPTTLYVNGSVIDLDRKGLIRSESGEALNDLKSMNRPVRLAPALLRSAEVPTIS
jgi:hypothetical protein